MIAIVNKGPVEGSERKDARIYNVQINDKLVCTFEHNRGDGLAECLRRAAGAVEIVLADMPDVSEAVGRLYYKLQGKFPDDRDVLEEYRTKASPVVFCDWASKVLNEAVLCLEDGVGIRSKWEDGQGWLEIYRTGQ